MPNAIFNYNVQINGKHEARIKGVIADVSSIIQESLQNGGKDSVIPKLFVEAKSNRQSEYFSIEDSLGLMKPTIDGDKPKTDKSGEIGNKRISHVIYTLDTMVTQTMMEDSGYGMDLGIERRARDLPESYFATRELLAQKAYTEAEKTGFNFYGAPIDLTTYDGMPLFSASHKYGAPDGEGHAKGTQSNLFYIVESNPNAGFMAEVLAQAAAEINQMKNANGMAQGFIADTIVTSADRRQTKLNTMLRQASGSEYFPGGNNNDINTQYGQWNMFSLNQWETDAFEFIVMSQKAKAQNKSMFFNRTNLDINVWTENGTRNVHWDSRARWGLGHVDYKHAVKIKVFKEKPGDVSGMTELKIG